MRKEQKYIYSILVFLFMIAGIAIFFQLTGEEEMEELKDTTIQKIETDPAFMQGPTELIRLEEEPNLVPKEFLDSIERNSDVYAWIDIPDTNVHYPILQGGPDDAYYLNHTIDKEAGYPGSIYTESINAKDFSDYNTVIYGHNMKDGSMFKHLHKFEDKEFFDTHEYITIYTESEMKMYRIYAAVVYSDKHIMKKFDFTNIEDRKAYIQSLDTGESVNQFREGMIVDEESRLVTLATCIGGRPNNRWLVIGELIER